MESLTRVIVSVYFGEVVSVLNLMVRLGIRGLTVTMADIMSLRKMEIRDGPCPSSIFTAVGKPSPPKSTPAPVNKTDDRCSLFD